VEDLGGGEGEDEFFLGWGKDKGGECLVIELDGEDGVDEEGEPALSLQGVTLEEGGAVDELLIGERCTFDIDRVGVGDCCWGIRFVFRAGILVF
tara:strand:+ start:1523 stop:1804 length:282 start_codon:yes stop_codon:yes gene_type:complete